MIFGVPESPRWLITRKGNEAAARKILAIVNPGSVDQVIAEIHHAQRELTSDRLFSGAYAWPILLAFLIAFFAFMMVLQLLFVVFPMPETRGRTLESLAEGLSRTAWPGNSPQ